MHLKIFHTLSTGWLSGLYQFNLNFTKNSLPALGRYFIFKLLFVFQAVRP